KPVAVPPFVYRRLIFSGTRRSRPVASTAVVTTVSSSVRRGLYPRSTRIGPTGDLYRKPTPGVAAKLPRTTCRKSCRFCKRLPPTAPASRNAAHSILRAKGTRNSTLPSSSDVPPTGRAVNELVDSPGAFGSHVWIAVSLDVSHRTLSRLTRGTVRIRGPSWFSSYPRTECDPPA